MAPVIANSAKAIGANSLKVDDNGPPRNILAAGDRDHFSSQWVLVSREAGTLKAIRDKAPARVEMKWSEPKSTYAHIWDDKSPGSLRGLLRSFDPAVNRGRSFVYGLLTKFASFDTLQRYGIVKAVEFTFEVCNRAAMARNDALDVKSDWLRKTK